MYIPRQNQGCSRNTVNYSTLQIILCYKLHNSEKYLTVKILSWFCIENNITLEGFLFVCSKIVSRPGVAGAVLQTNWLTDSLTDWWFVEISSRHLQSQTVWARDLNFWENVHLPPCVTCHVSYITCQVSHVICHILHVTCPFFLFFFLNKVVELVVVGSVINNAYPV